MKIVNFDNKVGTYILPNGYKQLVNGKSIEQQLSYLRVSSLGDLIYYEKDFTLRKEFVNCYKVEQEELVESIIVDDNIVVGVNIKTSYGILALFVEQGLIINDDMQRRFLFIVPEDFKN